MIHDANFVITGGTTGCRDDNLWCHQWWQSWHHDNSLSVFSNYVWPGCQLDAPNCYAPCLLAICKYTDLKSIDCKGILQGPLLCLNIWYANNLL